MKYIAIAFLVVFITGSCSPRKPDEVNLSVSVSSIKPLRGNFNTLVKITGTGLTMAGGIDSIQFNGKRAEIISTSDTVITTRPAKLSGTGTISLWHKGQRIAGPIFTYDTVAVVTTIAGNGNPGSNDAVGINATFNFPTGIAVDKQGNLFVADSHNSTIRKITPNGTVTTFAGKAGTPGYVDGTSGGARFDLIQGLAIDASDNLYACDIFNNRIRKITPDAIVTTIAGSGNFGSDDGQALQASFKQPYGLVVDNATGDIYIVDIVGNKIRKLSSSGIVSSAAGTGTAGFADGSAASAMFNQPNGIAIKSNGKLIIVDQGNTRIRELSNNSVSTIAGNGQGGLVDGAATTARFLSPAHAVVDVSGNIFVTDVSNNAIRKISTAGSVSTIAGGYRGSLDGIGPAAGFNMPYGIAIDKSGALYVTDNYNHKIRKITFE